MHSLSGSAPTVCGNHIAVFVLIELYAQFIQPLNTIRCFCYQLVNQFLIRCKVTAAVSIQKMLCRRIVWLIRSLNAAFCHHGICITNPQLGNHHNFLTSFVCFNGSRCTGTAAANDQNIGFIIRTGKIRQIILQTAVGLQQFNQFLWCFLALVRTNAQNIKLIFPIIRMVFLQNLFLFFCGHSSWFHRRICFSRSFYQLNGFQHFFCIHDAAPPYFSISRLLYISRISASDNAMFARIAASHLPEAISSTRSAR